MASDAPYLKEVPGFFEDLQRLTRAAHASHPDRLLTLDEIEADREGRKSHLWYLI
jgi:hypothetical protein